jgi:hypothetical protein
MKAWSRAQHAQEREAGLYAHHQAEAELISSYLNSQQAVEAAVAAVSSNSQNQPYGVPIPPPLVPADLQGYEDQPLPPQRSSSSHGDQNQQRSRGKRSRHAGTSSSSQQPQQPQQTQQQQQQQQQQHSHQQPQKSGGSGGAAGDIHYPKYDLYGHNYKYNSGGNECQYTTKYGEDCHFAAAAAAAASDSKYQEKFNTTSGGGERERGCAYNKTWPKQHCTDEEGRVYTQDDQQVQYIDQLTHEEQQRLMYQHEQQQQQQQQSRSKKNRNRSHGDTGGRGRDRSPQQPIGADGYPSLTNREREYLVSTGTSRHYLHEGQSKAANDPIPAIEEVGRYIEQAESRAKSVKDIARDLAKDRAVLAAQQDQQQEQIVSPKGQQVAFEDGPEADEEPLPNPQNIPPPAPPAAPSNNMETSQTLQTFQPQPKAATSAEVQLQQEYIQYVDNECCQVAIGVASTQPGQQPAGITETAASMANSATLPKQRTQQPHPAHRSKTGTMSTAQMTAQFGTLERNMAEVEQRNRESRAELQTQTLDRRSQFGGGAASCDTCDAPLTPGSLAGIDHRDLEHRPLTRSVTRATVFDEPPEK